MKVLELCTGGALLDRICSEKCLLEEEARRYVGQIVSAVDHMHQAGILHRYGRPRLASSVASVVSAQVI